MFSGTTKDHANDQYILSLDLETNQQYFIRLMSKSHSMVLFPALIVEPQLESVPCSNAAEDNAKSHALEIKHVSKDAQTLLAPTAPLSCP